LAGYISRNGLMHQAVYAGSVFRSRISLAYNEQISPA
jgi:hypothetical protein